MSWNWTLTTAITGAVTGSYGAVVSTLGRWDVVWRRRAKQLPTVRPALEALRDAVAEAHQKSRTISSLREVALRAHLEELDEARVRLSDGKLAGLIAEVSSTYAGVITAGDDSNDRRRMEALERAAQALAAALARADTIEKKAPA